LFGIENTLELQQFFNVLAYRTGGILNFQKVSQETKTSIKTVKKYLEYLESAFLIKVLHRVDIRAKRFKNIRQFKVYLTNPSLFTGLFGEVEINDASFLHLAEMAVFVKYLHREHNFLRYPNWKRNGKEGEVDLIQLSTNFQKVPWALEVKWSDSRKADKLKSFMKTNNVDRGIITSKTLFDNSSNILIAPNSIYAYVVGKNALDSLDSDF
jgi:predicted AAA+ superfamily ATPase